MILGAIFLLPLAFILYFLVEAYGMVHSQIGPVLKNIGIESVLGRFTVMITALILMAIFAAFTGWLLRYPIWVTVQDKMENFLRQFFPSFDYYKMRISARFANRYDDRSGAFLKMENAWVPVLVLEEAGEWVSVFRPIAPVGSQGLVMMVEKKDLHETRFTWENLEDTIEAFGKGMIVLRETGKL